MGAATLPFWISSLQPSPGDFQRLDAVRGEVGIKFNGGAECPSWTKDERQGRSLASVAEDAPRNCAIHRSGRVLQEKSQAEEPGEQLKSIVGTQISVKDCTAILKQYGKAKALCDGRRLHAIISEHGYDRSAPLGNCLIQMYGNCGSVEEARAAFDKIVEPNLFSWNLLIGAYAQNGSFDNVKSVFHEMPERDVVSWTAMIRACTQNGHAEEALEFYCRMQLEGAEPNKVTFICILNVCSSQEDLEEGIKIHAHIVSRAYELDVLVGTALVTMYGKCGNTNNARNVFNKMRHRDAIAWNAMIAAFSQNGQGREALEVFHRMKQEGIRPDKFTFISTLDACGCHTALQEGEDIHAAVVHSQYKEDVSLNNALVTMYGKCASLDKARQVFSEMSQRDVISWTVMITAYTQNGHGKAALELFPQMKFHGFRPSKITFISILDACTSVVALEKGREVHALIVESGYEQDVVVGNALVNMYGKCQSLNIAKLMFARMSHHDTVSWNIIISQNGHAKETLELFHQMHLEGVKPDRMTFIYILDTCASLGFLNEGQLYHTFIKNSKLENDIVVGNALITMYGRCRSLSCARSVFEGMTYRDIVTWNAMIVACAQNGHGQEALRLFHEMALAGMKPDTITFICILDGCAKAALLDEGKMIHKEITENGYEQDTMIGNALISMYGKCGSLENARTVLSRIIQRTVVSWNAVLTACIQNGHGREALVLFCRMKLEGVPPDAITFICTFEACTSLTALEEGQEIHMAVVDCGWELDPVLANALINMYGKCGSLNDARSVFRDMHHPNVVSWTAMIAACAQNGHGNEALVLFHQMQSEGVKPNHITFTCVLTACSQTGQLDDGRQHFVSINRDHGMTHTLEHYVCMIDLLCRTGHLDEAEDLIIKMPFKRVAVAWLSLLGACRIHGDLERGSRAAKICIELNPKNATPYIMMSHIYAASGRWDDVARMREALKNLGIYSQEEGILIEVNSTVQEFVFGCLMRPWKQELEVESQEVRST